MLPENLFRRPAAPPPPPGGDTQNVLCPRWTPVPVQMVRVSRQPSPTRQNKQSGNAAAPHTRAQLLPTRHQGAPNIHHSLKITMKRPNERPNEPTPPGDQHQGGSAAPRLPLLRLSVVLRLHLINVASVLLPRFFKQGQNGPTRHPSQNQFRDLLEMGHPIPDPVHPSPPPEP